MSASTSAPVIPVPLVLTPPTDSESTFRINIAAGTRSISMGIIGGDATARGIWLGSAAPSGTNYTLGEFNGGALVINHPAAVQIRLASAFSPVAVAVDATGLNAAANIKLWASGGLAVGAANVATDPGANNIQGTLLRQVTSATPTTGQTVTLGANSRDQLADIVPAGALAALTVAFPTNATSIAGQQVTVYISQNITTLTLSSTGATFPNGPVAWTAGEARIFVKRGTTWILVT